MSVLDRAALEASPLADLHAIASELSLDGYRRLRKADLIDAIIAQQGGEERKPRSRTSSRASRSAAKPPDPATEDAPEEDTTDEGTTDEGTTEEGATAGSGDDDDERPAGRRRRGRRGGRGRSAGREDSSDGDDDRDDAADDQPPAPRSRARRSTASGRGGDEPRSESRSAKAEPGSGSSRARDDETPQPDEIVEGEVELLPNGSGFVRVSPPEPSDDDVYISAAQVKRCELVSGDRIAGPRRAPRRSERFASLVRIDTINDRPASEVSEGARFDDLPAAFPSERLKLGSEDPTVKAIEWLTPIGKGSRVTITGSTRAGKTEALKRLAAALSGLEDVNVSVALAGVRPEEITDWAGAGSEPLGALSFAASSDAQAHAIELVLDRGRRTASRGGDAVVLIDTLDGIPPHAARKLTAAARNLADGGSLTVIATASEPVGGETTVIALDAGLAAIGRFPALDIVASGTLRPELLVGEAGAEAIARAREVAEEA
jgi:transcription termination factor Rho